MYGNRSQIVSLQYHFHGGKLENEHSERVLLCTSPMTCLIFSSVDSLSQSVEPNGQIGVPPCQVGFRKHSSCCLVWAPCVGAVDAAPLPHAPEHKGTSNWQTRYGRSLLRPIVWGLRCTEKKNIPTSKRELLQNGTGIKGKKKNVLHHSPCSSGVWAGRLYASASASSAALINMLSQSKESFPKQEAGAKILE